MLLYSRLAVICWLFLASSAMAAPLKEAVPEVTFIELGSVNCIPCRMMQPVMKQVEQKYGAKVKVVFHDVWTPQGEGYGRQYRIRTIPTQVFLDKTGREYARHEGFFDFQSLDKVIQQKVKK